MIGDDAPSQKRDSVRHSVNARLAGVEVQPQVPKQVTYRVFQLPCKNIAVRIVIQ
jgi:hypothetical protein